MDQFSGQRATLLFVGDQLKDTFVIEQVLANLKMPFTAEWVKPSGELAASTQLDDWDLAVILSTQRHPATALPLVSALLPLAQGRPVLLLLPEDQDTLGIHAIELGARDYLTTDKLARFEAVLKRELRDQLTSPRSLERGQFQRILNSASDAIITVNQRSEVLFFNHAAETIFEYSASEILGESLEQLLPKQFQQGHQRNIDAFAAGQETAHVFNETKLFHGKRKSGEEFPAEINISRFGVGESQRFTAIVRDITERVALEEKLHEYAASLVQRVEDRTAQLNAALQKAEELAKSKGDFLSTMSHEIRTPLNAIVGLSLLLNREALPEKAQELAGRIHQSGKHLVSLINDILDLSKLESGRVETVYEPFFLGDTLSHMAELMKNLATGKSLELAIHPPARRYQYLYGDAGKLVQILTNLISNAIKFTDEGEVLLAVNVLYASDTSVRLQFSVQDTGIGIGQAAQARLFAPYEQEDSTTARRYGGTGLGLAICKNLAEIQGGAIQLTSQLGQGSRFDVTLDYQLNPQAPQPEQPERPFQILFADDCEISREAIRLNTEELGYQTTSFSDGSALLSHFMANPALHSPDTVLILDHYMPNLTGAQVTQAIRDQLRPEHHPLIILASSDEPESFSDHPVNQLADAVVHKTFTSSGLYALIQRLLRTRSNTEIHNLRTPESKTLEGLKILVVDDVETNLEVAKGLFSSEGAEVCCLSDGLQAVQYLLSGKQQVDLVLMDISMPVLDGLQATEILRQHFDRGQLPIIALTAGALDVQREQALQSGMNDFISKPFELADAVATIQRTLTNEQGIARSEAAVTPATSPELNGDSPLFDPQRAMQLFQSPEIYAGYLNDFIQECESQLLLARTGNLDAKALAALAHRLAGTAGNLGLPAMHESAKLLERAAIFDEPTEALISAIWNLFEASNAQVHHFLAFQNGADKRPEMPRSLSQFNPDEIHALLLEAKEGLAAFSPASVEAPIQLLAAQTDRPEFHAILACMTRFDFNGAQIILEKLLAQFERPKQR